MLDRIKESKLDANVSVKLTAMGLDVGEELCTANMQNILERAREDELMIYVVLPQAVFNGFVGAAVVLSLAASQVVRERFAGLPS